MQATEDKIRQAALFSQNESEEELEAKDYPYLLVHAWLAVLTDAVSTRDATERYRIVQQMETYDETFLDHLEWYDLLSNENLAHRSRLAHSLNAQKQNDENQNALNTRAKPPLPNMSREQKIARYKQKKELSAQFEEMKKTGKTSDATFYKVWISLVAQERLEGQEMYILEKEMLSMAKQPPKTGFIYHRSANTTNQVDDNCILDVKKDSLFNAKGQPMRPFILHSNKEAIRQQVFRPGHNLPTMTIDEYLANEAKRGNVLSGGTNEDVAREKAVKEANEDEDRYNEDLWRKAVAWDDFKDGRLLYPLSGPCCNDSWIKKIIQKGGAIKALIKGKVCTCIYLQ